jgi:hypothetical protein
MQQNLRDIGNIFTQYLLETGSLSVIKCDGAKFPVHLDPLQRTALDHCNKTLHPIRLMETEPFSETLCVKKTQDDEQ